MIARISIIIMSLVALASCEKAISFAPRNAEPVVVIEATIESDQPPMVILSRSLHYFSEISPDSLAASFIRNAEVYMSNGATTHRLKEYALPANNGYTVYYYSTDSANLATAFEGEFNTRYSLQVKVDGKEYTAVTTIPALAKKFDSIWWEPAPNNPDTTKVIIMGRTTDPPGFGNYIRYFTQSNAGFFYPGLNSVFDDQIVDGKTYDIQIENGIDRNMSIDLEDYAFFHRGDIVAIKLSNIDKATFDFWRTMEYNYSSIGNPFSSPVKVLSNIKGGGLGYFGGYAVQFTTLVIPR
ncbi:DUF4249 domain-containing protein [Pseudoflavitalea sp. X16]|uniref:DUF4249 domain-containing protein n=1 Tax=Paraflavitalea devenefica TaxID=2716334 RepID=UPI0014237918|nr:DUF4249 domain-containing protein [Paraflavitalea devenefica]NII28131.1 DUF4249 domain-containing protein [Paraflavitalea devenefica]